MPGAAVGAAVCWGCGFSPLCARGALWGRGGRARSLGGGGSLLGWRRSPGRGLGVGGGCLGLPSRRADRHRRLCQLPLLALREGLPHASRGDGGAEAGPAVVAVVPLGGGLGVEHHCYPGRHAWWQACPLNYLLVLLCCAVGRAMQCFAGGGGEGGGAAVRLAPCGRGLVAIHRHWGGRWVSHAAHTSRHSSQSGAGLRALGPRGLSGGAEGSRTRWTPVSAVTSCVRRKVYTPSRAAGAGRGGRGTGTAPYRWVGVIPGTRSGSPRVATTRRSRGVPGRSCQRTCPLCWAPLVLERGVDRFRLAQPRGVCVASGGAVHQVGSLGNALHMTA